MAPRTLSWLLSISTLCLVAFGLREGQAADCTVSGSSALTAKRRLVRWDLENRGDMAATIDRVLITWPAANGELRKIRFRQTIFRGFRGEAPPPTLDLDSFRGRVKGRRLRPGERRALKVKFEKRASAAGGDYTIRIEFAEGCAVEFVQGGAICTPIACGCRVGDQIYEIGESFPAGDGCNTCQCRADGSVSCTEIRCAEGCLVEGRFYEIGETFPAGDGCNTCTCIADETVACTEIACRVCEHNGTIYRPGDRFPAGDGCNMCTCLEDGTVACTEMACPVVCRYNGRIYRPGETFLDDDCCNTCTCLASGAVACTDRACPAGCVVDGVFYAEGESFPAGDGCNFCTCVNGEPLCTLMPCVAPGCRSLDFEACQATRHCEWLVPGCGPSPESFDMGCYPRGECDSGNGCAPDERCARVTVHPCWSPDPDAIVCLACGLERTVCIGPRAGKETLCVATGGRWDPTSCGHYECGQFPPCDAIIPGCDCGPGRNFTPGRGCIADPRCRARCDDDRDCPPGSVCNRCDSTPDHPCNTCRPPGCVPLICDFDDDCPPGSRCVGSSVCPPDVVCVWEGRPGVCLPEE
jgi:hypothetical protein